MLEVATLETATGVASPVAQAGAATDPITAVPSSSAVSRTATTGANSAPRRRLQSPALPGRAPAVAITTSTVSHATAPPASISAQSSIASAGPGASPGRRQLSRAMVSSATLDATPSALARLPSATARHRERRGGLLSTDSTFTMFCVIDPVYGGLPPFDKVYTSWRFGPVDNPTDQEREPERSRPWSATISAMRWPELFADLEGQLAAESHRERDLEVADRTRRERAAVELGERLSASIDQQLDLRVRAAGEVVGHLADVGRDWLLLDQDHRCSALVPFGSILQISGCAALSASAPSTTRRFGLGHALRALSRDRAAVRLLDVDGRFVTGTLDRVGADHLDLAQHPLDLPRRQAHVTAQLVVPFAAVAVVWSR